MAHFKQDKVTILLKERWQSRGTVPLCWNTGSFYVSLCVKSCSSVLKKCNAKLNTKPLTFFLTASICLPPFLSFLLFPLDARKAVSKCLPFEGGNAHSHKQRKHMLTCHLLVTDRNADLKTSSCKHCKEQRHMG